MSKVIKAAVSIALSPATFGQSLLVFAISMVASAVISRVFAPNVPKSGQTAEPNPGQRQTLAPAGDNKLPVVYGTAWVGGTVIDLSITKNNQTMYWVIALSEVTNTDENSTGAPDEITFGNIYWGGKKCVFHATDKTRVIGLLDESTNESENVDGYLNIYLYKNGSNNPANTSLSAFQVMNSSDLVYTWSGSQLMSNCAFAIVKLRYSQRRNLTGLAQTRFQLTNARKNTGDCFYDYFVSQRYGAAINPSLIDIASLDELNAYSNELIEYSPYGGGTATIKRFEFNGILDTQQKIMSNIQSMSDCCNCLVRYDEITGKWGVIVQKSSVTPVMDINDSNMISSITVSPIDLSNSFNIIEVKFPDGTQRDSFNSATFDLAVINPSLLFPNEPVNKQSVNLYLINDSVRAQYLANMMLEAAREDLQITVDIDYSGLQLQAGDIVTVTNANYGWSAKLFRILKVTQKFNNEGQVFASLMLSEFNPSVYDDKNVTEFAPASNSGLGSPTTFGTIPKPTILAIFPSAANPAFSVSITTSSAGITQYAEIWYSAYEFPTNDQLIFAGTTEIQPNGNPYDPSTVIPSVQLFNIPAGNWYFFSRMVNALASSDFSPASNVLQWRPTTFQFVDRYLSIAYADSITGTGFSLNPRNKTYYGLYNQTTITPSTNASDYKWYLAEPAFGTNIYLVYNNRNDRKFSFDTDFATYAGGNGAFVPSTLADFDFRIWSALEDGTNIIDLDKATGQVVTTGTTSTSAGQLKVQNYPDGKLVAQLDQFLDFGGATTFTGSAATITVDIYGRVVGFTSPDDFYMTVDYFTATAGQTVFTPSTRNANYIKGQDLIFLNGLLLPLSDYTENSTTFTLNTGATLNDYVACVSFRAMSSGNFYEPLNMVVDSVSTNKIIYKASSLPQQLINIGDKLTFNNTGTPTQYTVSNVNYTTREITFTSNPTVSANDMIYRYRASGSSYPVFSRFEFDLTNSGSYTPSTWAIRSGYELIYINGTIANELDYDIVNGVLNGFPSTLTGKISFIQFGQNNLTTPIGTMQNIFAYTESGKSTYSFIFNALAFNLYSNGCLFKQDTDYVTSTNSYTYSTVPDFANATVQQTFASAGTA